MSKNSGVVLRRSGPKSLGIFVDGSNLDLAGKRLGRKVDYPKLLQSLCHGHNPASARYYTVIPHEDDSRHRSYLDAVKRAGLDVVITRLPPKGIHRQVDVLPLMAADMVAFALGHTNFSKLGLIEEVLPEGDDIFKNSEELAPKVTTESKKTIIIVCPSRDLSYPISLVKELGADTISADFGEFAGNDVLKNAAKWIDLSDSESIWRE